MSAILDNITGGGLLPHIYCKKVTLENSSEQGLLDVTLSLELYQDKKRLLDSAWLNALDDGNSNFLDAMFIQVLEYKKFDNVKSLLPSSVAHGAFNFSGPGRGSLYGGKIVYGDNYLPRGTTGQFVPGQRPNVENMFSSEPGSIKAPIQISNSSIIGNIASKDALLNYEAEGKVREEIIDGKQYYIIPFEYRTVYNPDTNSNLGFAFYAFLDVPYWAVSLDIGVKVLPGDSFFEEFVVEGPVNSEVVYMAGSLQKEREALFLPNGEVWEGAAHVHSNKEWLNNPAPDGYVGDGGFSNLDLSSDFKGWMVGEEHNSAEEQPKLRLARVPNNKLLDLRSTTKGKVIEEVSALGLSSQQETTFAEQSAFDKMLAQVGAVFQKDKKKDFVIDNDSEYSRLYLSRDLPGNARGIFFINLEELLKNNSQIYPKVPGLVDYFSDIISKSSLLEIKLYRDRIKEHTVGRVREVYANDEIYEEPSKLVATLSPLQSTAAAKMGEDYIFTAINIDAPGSEKNRYFMFADYNVSTKAAGLYQYRLEVNFKDGTYEFLYDIYKQLVNTKISLEQYYDLATSTYTDPAGAGFTRTSYRIAKEFSKAAFKQYFKNGSYDQQFVLRASALFSENYPWLSVPTFVLQMQKMFQGPSEVLEGFENALTLTNSLDPVTGSPKGIENVTNLISAFIKQLEKVLEINKFKKVSSGFTNTSTSGDFDSFSLLSNFISQANHTIYENHSFDHPAELFEAISNKYIYSEYLSLDGSAPKPSPGQALKVVNAGDFIERCKAEVAKYSIMPLVPAQIPGGEGPLYNIDFYSSGGALSTAQQSGAPRYLSDTGYSYLAPSVIELSTGIKDNNFAYRPLQLDGLGLMEEGAENLLVALLNYSFNKEGEKNADLLDGPFSYEQFGQNLALRETYKELFEKIGMTVHDNDLHDQFFLNSAGHEREAGAVSIDIPESGHNMVNTPFGPIGTFFTGQYKAKDFSDDGVTPNTFFKSFANNKQTAIKKLKAFDLESLEIESQPVFYDMPNNFKIARIRNNHYNVGDQEIATFPWRAISNNQEPYNTYLFFNLNLTVKIEVFRGLTRPNAKYDEESWSLLTKEDLDNISGMLLCRMSYYDEKLTKDLNLPILDKHFLMAPGAAISGLAAIEEINQMTFAANQADVAENTFWAEKNEQKMEEYSEQTGNSMAPGGGIQAAGTSNVMTTSAASTEETAPSDRTEAAPVVRGRSIPTQPTGRQNQRTTGARGSSARSGRTQRQTGNRGSTTRGGGSSGGGRGGGSGGGRGGY